MERVDRHPVGRVAVGVVAGTAEGIAAAEGIAVEDIAAGTESVEDIAAGTESVDDIAVGVAAGTAVVVGHSQGVLAILSSRFGWIHRPWAQVLGQWEIAGWCCFACC